MPQTTEYSPAARRYAEAVMAIARDGGTQDQWVDDLDSIAQLVQDPGAGPFLASERTADTDKLRLIERTLVISPLAMNLAKLLFQRRRLALAPQVAAEYRRMLDEQRNIANAEVTTAVPLSESEQRAVAERLRELMRASEVRLTTKIDPALIGGMVARIGDRLIDGSTRTRLVQLKRSLAGEVT